MAEVTPLPKVSTISINSEDYEIEDTVARARAEAAYDAATNASGESAALEDVQQIQKFLRNEWEGRNILEDDKLSAEIAQETSWITWIKNRIDLRYYEGLMIRDYIPIKLSDGTDMPYAIGRFDGTFGAGDQEETDGSIDFVPIFAYPSPVQFNTTNTNQGTSVNPNPYCASRLHEWELNTYFQMLPADLQNAIVNRRVISEFRYKAGQTLTDSTGWGWTDIGKIWSLSEMEVYGCVAWGTIGYGVGLDTQFPIFAQTKDRIRRSASDSETRYRWWLRVAYSGDSAGICNVGDGGNADGTAASNASIHPVPCFRL